MNRQISGKQTSIAKIEVAGSGRLLPVAAQTEMDNNRPPPGHGRHRAIWRWE